MALLANDKLTNLGFAVSDVIQGQPFILWAESTAQNMVNKVTKTCKEVDINSILTLRNIILHELIDASERTAYKASLINNISHFDLYIDLPRINSNNEKKFILAHEIAHTLFYTNSSEGLNKKTSLSFGSDQIENICDYLAICLLLPKAFIEKEISIYKMEKDTLRMRNENYLKFVFHLAAKYQVGIHYILYRLIVNFNFLPNSLCIEFIKKDKWYLTCIYQADSLRKKNLFIPNKSKSDTRFVSAKKSFVDILERIVDDSLLQPNMYGHLIVKKTNFDSYYQGNIKQFLFKYFTQDLDILKIYYRINTNKNVLLLFPFDGLLI